MDEQSMNDIVNIKTKIVIETQNKHTLTVVSDEAGFTLRIAKDGHNRAIAKITGDQAKNLVAFVSRNTPKKG
jgi:hypothetical protein